MLSLFALHDRFIIQSEDCQRPSLQISRQSAHIELVDGPLDQRLVQNASSQHSFGIVGTIQLLAGRYLLHVTKAEIVTNLLGFAVYKVSSVDIIPFSTRRMQDDLPDETARTEEEFYLEMLRSVLTRSSFHFSYSYDITNTVQRNAAMPWKRSSDCTLPDLISRADPRFFWNRYLLSDFSTIPISPWAIVLVSGFFECRLVSIGNIEFYYGLLSRRSSQNAGKRFTRRGLDHNGDPTNFAEQEQIVWSQSASSDTVLLSSFVQTRGSVPLVWTQEACLKWAPPLSINLDSRSTSLLNQHLSRHFQIYGRTVLLNLVNQSGKEAAIVSALSACVPPYSPDSSDDYSLVSFDFHKNCKNMKYENIQLLLDRIKDDIQSMGFWCGSFRTTNWTWTIEQDQKGCFRTNCMDCLDRTNVVQSAIGALVLPNQLRRCEISNGSDLRESPALYSIFREVWADNADVMSRLYSGTDALKTDYTKTGSRSLLGACNDGKNSILRFYLNNFCDGYCQDALDLFLGNYRVVAAASSRDLPYAKSLKQDGLPFLFNYLVSRSLLIFISTLLLTVSLPPHLRPSFSNIAALSFFIGPAISLALARKDLRSFVDKPKLVPSSTVLSPNDKIGAIQKSPALKSE